MPPAPGTLPSFASLPPSRMRTPTTQSKELERGAAILPRQRQSLASCSKKKCLYLLLGCREESPGKGERCDSARGCQNSLCVEKAVLE